MSMYLFAAIFQANQWLVSILYPLTFFLMGFGILLKNKMHSRFHLGNSLNYMGLFGLVHSFADWGNSLIPLQSTYLNGVTLLWLKYGQIVLYSFSFTLLFYFGIHLLQQSKLLNRRILLLPATAFSIWLIISIFIEDLLPNTSFIPFILTLSNMLIAIPAGLLSAYSIYAQKQQFIDFKIPFMSKTLTFTALSLIIYTLCVGLVFPYAHLFSGSLIKWIRSFDVAIIFVFILRILRAFDMEYQQFFRSAERAAAQTEERNRIARDLHDGMIQSIYAFGLQLDNLCYQYEGESPPSAKATANHLRDMIRKLNDLISEIRDFIVELKDASGGSSTFCYRMESLISDMNRTSNIPVQLQCVLGNIEFPLWVSNQIYYIIKEALTNVIKHSKAEGAIVHIRQNSTNLFIEVKDNGRGFKMKSSFDSDGFKQGMNNMKDRAEAIGGVLIIDSRIGTGTSIKLSIALHSIRGDGL